MMKIPIMKPFFDEKESQAVAQVLESGWVVQGPKTQEFEKLFSNYTGIKYSKAVTSCTTALHIGLTAAGVKPGEEVIVPSFTFVATANAVEYIGATPVFCDIDLATFNMSPVCLQKIIDDAYILDSQTGLLKNKNNGKILRAVLPVHLFGLAADLGQISKIASKYNLRIVEDAACAVGSKINGKHVGAFGNIACFSFHPRKAITTGEGGMITSDREEEAALFEALRNHGATVSDLQRHKKAGYLLPEYNMLGFNYRMTDIQGAVGAEQMKKLPWIMQTREEKAQKYDQKLQHLKWLVKPYVPEGYTHGYQSYVCRVDERMVGGGNVDAAHEWRNKLMDLLEQKGVATRQGTHAVHILGFYRNKYDIKNGDFPNSYSADRLSLALPLFSAMTDEEQDYVVDQMEILAKTISF